MARLAHFATGTVGNWGPHSANLPFKAMQVEQLWQADSAGQPRISVHVEMSELERVGFPRWSSIRYEIPPRGQLPPLELQHHYGSEAGRQRIEARLGRRLDWGDAGERKWKDHGGCLVVGTEGMIHATEHNSSFTLLPEDKFADFQGPPPTLPRSGSHERKFRWPARAGPRRCPISATPLRSSSSCYWPTSPPFRPVPGVRSGDVPNHRSRRGQRVVRREYRTGWTL